MVDDDDALRMREALQGASSMQLYRMRALIDEMLADTKRTVASRAALHLGQHVRFVDHRSGQVRHGTLIARHDTQATVLEEGVRRTWKIPYVAIEAAPGTTGEQTKVYDPPPEPVKQGPRAQFKVGSKITFDDARGVAQVGMITRINRRTATLQTTDGKTWRVGFELLRHVVEV
jgi:hypothetical protein